MKRRNPEFAAGSDELKAILALWKPKKAKRPKSEPRKPSSLEETADRLMRERGLKFVREHRGWHPERGWRFDFAFPEVKIAVEIEGGVEWKGSGRHTTPPGFDEDCRKYNEAAILGWTVLRFTRRMLHTIPAKVEQALRRKANQ